MLNLMTVMMLSTWYVLLVPSFVAFYFEPAKGNYTVHSYSENLLADVLLCFSKGNFAEED